MLSLQRAKEIKAVFLNEIEATRTLPGRLVTPFYEFYNGEFNPGRYAQQPCGCSPREWMRMIDEVTKEVNEVLSAAKEEESKAIMEEPKPQPVKKKKVIVDAEDK